MAIHSIEQLLARVQADLPDNITQEISPADVRNLFKDILESIAPAYVAIQGVPAVTLTLNASTYTPIKPYSVIVQETPGFFNTSLVNGTIGRILGSVAGSTQLIMASGQIGSSAGRDVTVKLHANGAPLPYQDLVTTRGPTNFVTYNIVGIHYSPVDVLYDVRAIGVAATYNFSGTYILAQMQPVRSYT